MGLVVRRKIAHLDNDVIAGLVNDQSARDFVESVRRNGHDLYIPPAVVRQMCTAPTSVRAKLVEAAMKYCKGFSNLPGYDLLLLEIDCLAKGRMVPPPPTLPIARLAEILPDQAAATMKNKLAKLARAEERDILDELARSLRDRAIGRSFDEFRKEGVPPVFKVIVDSAPDGRGIGALKAAAKHSPRPRADKYGLVGLAVLLCANVYRRAHNVGKGAGCFSDLMMMVEVSHADVLLTRDTELAECWKLVASVIDDVRPQVLLVPQP